MTDRDYLAALFCNLRALAVAAKTIMKSAGGNGVTQRAAPFVLKIAGRGKI